MLEIQINIGKAEHRVLFSDQVSSSPKPLVYLSDKEEVKKVFNHFDANGDGKISATELISVMKALQSNTSEDEVKRMMTELNTSLNGFISLEEFQFLYGRR
ncbi:hypothetical protein LOK49_Contig119G00010 [Camellia lanceoleosa]|nr:hypothetical protein LOK49_Contig119G00010 [Camellia lanceoleosa]